MTKIASKLTRTRRLRNLERTDLTFLCTRSVRENQSNWHRIHPRHECPSSFSPTAPIPKSRKFAVLGMVDLSDSSAWPSRYCAHGCDVARSCAFRITYGANRSDAQIARIRLSSRKPLGRTRPPSSPRTRRATSDRRRLDGSPTAMHDHRCGEPLFFAGLWPPHRRPQVRPPAAKPKSPKPRESAAGRRK